MSRKRPLSNENNEVGAGERWNARQRLSSDESAALAQLGDRLKIEAGTRKRAASAAFDISVMPEGGRPDKYDFVKLVARLKEKLPQLAT